MAAGILAAVPLAAQQTPPADAQDRVHVVRVGDTLWDLARAYLNDPFLWPEIFRLNTAVVRDPALIYPRERLVLPAGVQARLSVAGSEGRTVFWRDPAAQAVSNRLDIRAAGTADVPALAPGDFYRASLLVPDREMRPIGRIQGVMAPTVVPIERAPQINVYDKIYVRLDQAGARAGDRLHFMRPEREVKPWGRVWQSTGTGTVISVDGAIATVEVDGMYDRVGGADRVFRRDVFSMRAGVAPTAAGAGLDGSVIALLEEHPVQTNEDVVFLDAGRLAGVKEGDEFIAYLPRATTALATIPEEEIGRLQVVRTTPRTATARIMSLKQPALQVGARVRRVARMP